MIFNMEKNRIIHLSKKGRTERYIMNISKPDMNKLLKDIEEKKDKVIILPYSIDKSSFTLGDIDMIGESSDMPDKELERLLPTTERAKEKDIYYRSNVFLNEEPYQQLESQRCDNSRDKYK